MFCMRTIKLLVSKTVCAYICGGDKGKLYAVIAFRVISRNDQDKYLPSSE